MNKKKYILAAALLSISSLTACGPKNTENKSESVTEIEMETTMESNIASNSQNQEEVYKFEANITEINENKLTVSLNNDYSLGLAGETLIVIVDNENNYDLNVGDNIEVEYDGIIMTSYPGQLFASKITVLDDSGNDSKHSDSKAEYKFKAIVIEKDENSLTVTPFRESEESKVNEIIVVNIPQDASYEVKNGDTIEVEYNGIMTKSIPPQISASKITLEYNNENIDE